MELHEHVDLCANHLFIGRMPLSLGATGEGSAAVASDPADSSHLSA